MENIDIIEAERRKNEAQDRCLEQTNTDWKAKALQVLKAVAETHKFFIVDQVREMADKMAIGKPEKHGVWGSLFREAARQKIIKKTNRFRVSQLKSNNMGVRQLWRSLVLKSDPTQDDGQEFLNSCTGVGDVKTSTP
jgi:hypothetical protein